MDEIRVELLSIGSELLHGETVDTNLAFLGGELTRLGAPPRLARQLPDDRELLAAAFGEARERSRLVVATGGLGPTHDDLTREALAAALAEELRLDDGLLDALVRRFEGFGRGPMPETNRQQALLVPSAEPIPNPIGSAPGWWVDRDGAVVVLMPGVPSEMRRMWSEQVAPRLRTRFSLPTLHLRVVKTFGLGESAAADRLAPLLSTTQCEAGIYARDDGIHVRFSSRTDAAAVHDAAARAAELLGEEHVYGLDEATLPAAALAALGTAGARTVASWEADTDGALLAILAATPAVDGISFVGGVLDRGGSAAVPNADAVIQLSLLPADESGRSRVEVAVSGMVSIERRRLAIHGSGPQRLRRAAFAALDIVRRSRSLG